MKMDKSTFLQFASRSAAVIFVEIVAMMYSEVQRTGHIILPVRCTSLFFVSLSPTNITAALRLANRET